MNGAMASLAVEYIKTCSIWCMHADVNLRAVISDPDDPKFDLEAYLQDLSARNP